MSEDTENARKDLLEKLKSNVTAEEVLEAIDNLIESRIADFAEMMAEKAEQHIGVRP